MEKIDPSSVLFVALLACRAALCDDCVGEWVDRGPCLPRCEVAQQWNTTRPATGNGTCAHSDGDYGGSVPCVGELCFDVTLLAVVTFADWPDDNPAYPLPTADNLDAIEQHWFQAVADAYGIAVSRMSLLSLSLDGYNVLPLRSAEVTRRRLLQQHSSHRVQAFFSVESVSVLSKVFTTEVFAALLDDVEHIRATGQVDNTFSSAQITLKEGNPYITDIALARAPVPSVVRLSPLPGEDVPTGGTTLRVTFDGEVRLNALLYEDSEVVSIRLWGIEQVASVAKIDVSVQPDEANPDQFVAEWDVPPGIIRQVRDKSTWYSVDINHNAIVVPGDNNHVHLEFTWRLFAQCPEDLTCTALFTDNSHFALTLLDVGPVRDLTNTELEPAVRDEIAALLSVSSSHVEVVVTSRVDERVYLNLTFIYWEGDTRPPFTIATQLADILHDVDSLVLTYEILSLEEGRYPVLYSGPIATATEATHMLSNSDHVQVMWIAMVLVLVAVCTAALH